jgi:hypothetical protein
MSFLRFATCGTTFLEIPKKSFPLFSLFIMLGPWVLCLFFFHFYFILIFSGK